ncbi:hypothetical protein QTP70_019891 [Hemibagrus guttatus]|uniref:Uncharacterized protein n=1 Tax=Hemibagrus guttatus TaxID=175788 RepID=A0AAE0QB48_9TELE|nr:hypothetical protein QTP70_019891 [Hemibagrus guttatus]
MNWDNQLSHIISAADGSVAKIRERLAIPGRLSREREDAYPVRDLSHAVALEPSVHLSGAVQWSDLAAVQAQLHNQRQTIESLTQNLRSVERERDAQQRQIQMLQEEVRRLRERLEAREKERERKQDIEEDKVPAVEMKLEQWKREVGRELSALRGHMDRATSLGNREESFSSKLCREEVDRLRREVDLLKSKLNAFEAAVAVEMSPRRRSLSDSDDELSPTPSLGDVSSDDLDTSWLGDSAPKLRSHGRVARLSLSGSDLSDTGSGLGSNHSKVGGASDSSPDLSLCDL